MNNKAFGESNPIKELYEMNSDFIKYQSTPFDFYLDFIGYTTDRNLKKEEEEEKKRNPRYRDYERIYKIRNSIHLRQFRTILRQFDTILR